MDLRYREYLRRRKLSKNQYIPRYSLCSLAHFHNHIMVIEHSHGFLTLGEA